MSRSLYAIMFTDIVDFTSLMHQNEADALKQRERFKTIITEAMTEFGGTNLQFFGDGTHSLFKNAIDSIRCAISIQQKLLIEPEVPVRIGLHLGDVIENDNEILGDSVNIASRIESFSISGAIFISDSLHDHVKNQPDIKWKLMGSFQLKNVERSYDIYALDFPGIKVPGSDFILGKGRRIAEFKRSFPLPSQPILGREEEVNQILNLVNEYRVVTITGTGGIGKTRLSLELCERLKGEYGSGISWISMSTLSDVEEVMPMLANHLGIHESKGRSPLKSVSDTIADAKALLVLDNLEHVIEAAREVAELSNLCPNLKIICTSRTALKITNEKEYKLSTLTIPENVELAENYSSVILFVERAKEAKSSFQLDERNRKPVVDICKRLDGLPLAIELAAARTRIMTPAQIMERLGRSLDLLDSGLRDVADRHRTLRSTIGWSYELLNEAEKKLFSRLSIFSGGFTLEAVEKICYSENEDSFIAIIQLESLIDKGLVSEDSEYQRFFLLQTIRDFAAEILVGSDDVDWLKGHYSDWFLEYSHYVMEGTYGKDQEMRVNQADREAANFSSVLDHLLEKARQGDITAREKGLSICGNLWMYWHMKGKNISTNEYVNSFLNASDEMDSTIPRCSALMGSIAAYWITGDFDKSLERAQLKYAMARELNDQVCLIKSLIMLTIASLIPDIQKSSEYAELARREAKNSDPYWLASALYFQGLTFVVKENIAEAERCFTEGLEIGEPVGDHEVMGGLLSGFGLVDISKGNIEKGMKFYQKAIESFEIVGDRAEVARILSEMSWAYIDAGEVDLAREHTIKSVRVYQEVGSTRGVGLSLLGLAAVEALEGNSREAMLISMSADHFAEQEGIVNDFGYNSYDRSLIDKMKKRLSEEELKEIYQSAEEYSVKEVLELAELHSVILLDS